MNIELKDNCTVDVLKKLGFEQVFEGTGDGTSIQCFWELKIKKLFYTVIVDINDNKIILIGVEFKEPKTKFGTYILYHFRLGEVNSTKIEKELLRLGIFEKT